MIMDVAELNKLVENTVNLLKEIQEAEPQSREDREYYKDLLDQFKSNLLELIDAKIQEALDHHEETYNHDGLGHPLTREEFGE